MSQSREEKLTADDLQYIRLALILALGNPDMKDMPSIESQLKLLQTKINGCIINKKQRKRTMADILEAELRFM